MSRARRTGAWVVALATALTLSACGIGMPDSGPVQETDAVGTGASDGAVNSNPRSPGTDDSPQQIVRGFLVAMTATPATTTAVAREFLTDEAAAAWQPTETIIYRAITSPRGGNGNNEVEATLVDASRTDARGGWLGAVSEDETTLRFPMKKEDGQWRIAEVPNALIVPQSWFEQRFRPASLYFFDASGSLLVPDPVFVPRGKQFASTLVNGLLTGPAPALAGYELNFLPTGLRSLVSVPVSDAGVAQVDLKSDSADDLVPAPPDAELLVSQLAWTLRQDPTIERFRVTIDGRLVQLAGQETEFSVDHGHEFAPYVAGSSTQLFGLQDGVVVGGSPQNLEAVPGPFGQPGAYSLRAVAPDIAVERAAAISSDGTTLFLGPVREVADPVLQLITTGEDLLRPAWDFSGRLWSIDRRTTGSVVQYLQDDEVRTLQVPGVSGMDVKDFLVSRDGSRLVAVIRTGPQSDTIVVSRILTRGDGKVVGALPAVDVTDPDDRDGQIRTIAWRSPTSIVVLDPVNRALFQVRTASLDGAPSGLDAISPTLDQDIVGLSGTPVPGESAYAFTSTGFLIDLTDPLAAPIPVGSNVTSLDYVG